MYFIIMFSCAVIANFSFIRAIETGAHICPTYVFGANDFYNNLMTSPYFRPLVTFSRKWRTCVSLFWGQYGLPVLPI